MKNCFGSSRIYVQFLLNKISIKYILLGFSIINKYHYQLTSVITCQFILINNIFLGSKIDIRIQNWMLAKTFVISEVKSWMKRKNTVDSKFCQPNSVLCKLDAGGKFVISFLAIFCNLSNVSFVNHFLSRFSLR